MAYKEFLITSTKASNAFYWNVSAELPKAGYPDNDTYLAVRNAAVPSTFTLNRGTILVGQHCEYDINRTTYKYSTYRGTLHFDNALGIMTGAPIEYALLRVYQIAESNDEPFILVITNGQPTYPHIPAVAADYNITNYSGNGGELPYTADGYGYKYIELNETGLGWIDIDEDYICRLCLQTQDDIDAISTGNLFTWPSIEIYNTSYTPRLTIHVTLSIPTARSDEYTNIESDTATFNGEITNSGYWLDSYGFEWKQGEDGDITSVTVGTNRTTGLVYNYNKTSWDTGIWYRAFGTNDAGTGYGEWIHIVEIEVTTQAATQIAYQCAMGNGTITSGTNATERGFEINVEVNYYGVGGDIWWGLIGFNDEGGIVYDMGRRTGTLVKRETKEGDFVEGAFAIVLGRESILGNPDHSFDDALIKCTSYTYRAYAVIDGETYFGEYVAFDTLCDAGGDQQPTDDISEGDPTVPIIPIEPEPEYPPFIWEPPEEIPYPPWDWDLPDIPPWILPDLPEWEMPDYPPQSFVGDFYYHKPYTKKDLDELRKKCIIYNKNSVEFALVLRHNMNVLREFFNMMTDYMDKDEFNDFTDTIPPQKLKELYLDPLEVNDFKDMINGFIRNTVDDNIAVNRNFSLIQEGLADPQVNNEEGYFTDIYSAMKTVTEDNPDVDTLKGVIDNLNQEVAGNFDVIMKNLQVIRARLL